MKIVKLIAHILFLLALTIVFTLSMLFLLFGMYLQQYDAVILGFVFSAITGGLGYGILRAES